MLITCNSTRLRRSCVFFRKHVSPRHYLVFAFMVVYHCICYRGIFILINSLTTSHQTADIVLFFKCYVCSNKHIFENYECFEILKIFFVSSTISIWVLPLHIFKNKALLHKDTETKFGVNDSDIFEDIFDI